MSRRLFSFVCCLYLLAPLALQAGDEDSPELQTILEQWHKQTSQVKECQGSFYRCTYDHRSQEEHREQGELYYQAPHKIRIDFRPVPIAPGEVGSKKDSNSGKPYELKPPVRTFRWISTNRVLVVIQDDEKQFDFWETPKEIHGRYGSSLMKDRLGFLFGMEPDLVKRRYQLKLLKASETQLWVALKPNWRQDSANMKEAKVILDAKTFLPVAMQQIDPSGNRETVYTFSKLKVNDDAVQSKLWTENVFRPDLGGYRKNRRLLRDVLHLPDFNPY